MLHRNLQPELMDQEGLDEQAHRRALAGLARINAWSRSAAILWPAIRQLAKQLDGQPLRILDVASGGGDVCLGLWHKARRAGIKVQILGLDISPLAVEVAREQIPPSVEGIGFEVHDVFRQPLTERYHVAMSSLFLHHLTEVKAVELLAGMASVSEHSLLINDLCRTRSGIVMAHMACRLLTRSSIVHFDGPQSVAAAFTTTEMASLFERAGLSAVRIDRRWPCRQLARWCAGG